MLTTGQAVDIKQAKYGLGAFAAQDMKSGDFIGGGTVSWDIGV
jgi:hypothetical protein